MRDFKKGIVLYTDGSCRPTNPGNIGWGSHGYLYEVKELKKPVVVDNHLITNKGYLLGPKLVETMSADLVEPIKYFDFCGSTLEIASNNSAEIRALYHSLIKIEDYKVGHIQIRTDSEYLKNCVSEWCYKWARNNWTKPDGSPVSNSYYLKLIYEMVQNLKTRNVIFRIDWIKAHAGNLGNTQADALAVIGMLYSRAKIDKIDYTESDAKGYWKHEVERHPFINFKRIYFNSIEKFNTAGEYFQADSGAGDFIIGKRIPESGFSVIKLKQPDTVIEATKQAQFDASNDINAIIMMKLDRVYSKELYRYLRDHGKYCLYRGHNNLNMNFDDKPVTLEINPTGLSLRAIESFNFLDEILTRFIQKDNSIEGYNYHDITDQFYNKIEKTVKKEVKQYTVIKPELTNAVKDLKIPIVEVYQERSVELMIPMVMGLDILQRNNLKKLEELNPKVHLVTWRESPQSLRYATIIECDDGIGIWSNYFADKIFFK